MGTKSMIRISNVDVNLPPTAKGLWRCYRKPGESLKAFARYVATARGESTWAAATCASWLISKGCKVSR